MKPLPASPRWDGGDVARASGRRDHNMPPRRFQPRLVGHAPPPCFPVARWLTGSLVHICPLTLCSSLISCSRPRRLASFVRTWLRLCITPLFTLVPSEPGCTCANPSQPCTIGINPVKHVHGAYVHIQPLRVHNVHIFAYAKI